MATNKVEELNKKLQRLEQDEIILEDLVQVYGEWDSYDEMLSSDIYHGPVLGADEVARLVPECFREKARVLDVAAGTGKVGLELHKRGFRNIDALEPCEAFLNKVKATGVYKHTYLEFLGVGKSSIPKDTYDIVIAVGCLGATHIPIAGVDEMIHVIKPGGVMVAVTREALLCKEFPLKRHLEQLEERGVCRKEKWSVGHDFLLDHQAVIVSYRVL